MKGDESASRGSLLGRLVRVGVWGMVALLLLLVATVFIASRPVSLQWAAQKAVQLSDGRLKIDGIAGSILKEISADSVQWRDAGIVLTVTAPRLGYEPFALFDGIVRIDRLSAASVEVVLPMSADNDRSGGVRQQFKPPAVMRALLPMVIDRIDVGRIVVRRDGADLAEVRNIQAALRHDGDRLNASLHDAALVVGRTQVGIRGEAAVSVRRPYATDARFFVQVPVTRVAKKRTPLRVDVRLNGPLEELALRAGTVFEGATVDARSVVYLLDSRPLRQVRLDLKDFDLSRYDATLPTTRLNASFDAEVMPAWASERKPLLIGPVNVTNLLAGSFDSKRVPLAAAKAVVGYVEGRLEVRNFEASGPLGELTGDGWFAPDSFRVALASDNLHLHGIDATLAPHTMKAELAVEPIRPTPSPSTGPVGTAAGLKLELKASDAALAADVTAVLADSRLNISKAQVRLKNGAQVDSGLAGFSGSVGVAAPWPVDLSGDFRDFDPAQLLAMPPGQLNGTWRVAGRIGGLPGSSIEGDDRGLIQADIALEQSRFRDQPLAGNVTGILAFRDGEPQRLSAVSAALKWGAGTVEAKGALGDDADSLHLAFAAPRVGDLVASLAGAVSGRATLRGHLQAPTVQASVDCRRLAATTGGVQTRIAHAALELSSERPDTGVFELQAKLSGIEVVRTSGDTNVTLARFERLNATIDGSRSEHTADLEAVGKNQHLVMGASGGLGNDGLWRGTVTELAASHPWLRFPVDRARLLTGTGTSTNTVDSPQDVQLLLPFALELGPKRIRVRDAHFGVQGANLNLKRADWQMPTLTLEADASGVAASWLGRFGEWRAQPEAPLRTTRIPKPERRVSKAAQLAAIALHDLRLGATINFTGDLTDTSAIDWSGTLRIRREGGDLQLLGAGDAGPADAGLRTLDASATLNARVVKLVVAVDGENIGRIGAEAQTTLRADDEPAWAKASLAASPLAGRVEFATNSIRWLAPRPGNDWRIDGALSAHLDLAGTLTRPRADGVVTGSNLSAQQRSRGMSLRDGVLAAELSGDRVDVKMLRFDSGAGSVAISGVLQAPASGKSQAYAVIDRLPIAVGAGQQVLVSGSATATLEDHSLSVDGQLVVDEALIDLKGGGAPSGSRNAAPKSSDAGSARITTNIGVDLGRHFRVVGNGLTARLNGAIQLHGSFPPAPSATGSVEIGEGTYVIRGDELGIERGRIVFNGPLDDPIIDIVASRQGVEGRAGGDVDAGTGSDRVIEISGNASAPQARLTDRRERTERRESSESSESSVAAKPRPTAPGSGFAQAQDGLVTVARQLSSSVFSTVEESLRGVWNILELQYEISDRLSLSRQVGSDSAVDLLGFFPFD